jgi:hypothetical protein
MKPMFFGLLPMLAIGIIGCGTLDLTKEHSGPAPVCEVHNRMMTPEMIHLTTGELAYVWGFYSKPLKEQFPHHGDWVYQGERPYGGPYAREVHDFVCPDCTAAFHRFWEKSPMTKGTYEPALARSGFGNLRYYRLGP